VTVATAVQKPMPVTITAIGTVQPLLSVTVRSQVDGTVERVNFVEGQDVNAGELLFVLDRRPLEADLRKAEAALAKDQATAEAAERDEQRYAALVQQGLIAQQQYDQARANAQSLAATVAADRAVVQNARIQLRYTEIRAPITGRTGAILAQRGNLVTAQNTSLVVINQIKPIQAAFTVPEQFLGEIRQRRAAGSLPVDASPSSGQPVARGALTFIDNRVDPATGTIQLKATFANTDAALWPGEFVNLVLTLSVDPAAIVVPAEAVQSGQDSRYVFVVKPDGTADMRPVTVAREAGRETVIARGVAAGETVVTDGQLRLTPGVRVAVHGPPDPGNALPRDARTSRAPAR
jgi:multidrug efflux system membrane fusion protein